MAGQKAEGVAPPRVDDDCICFPMREGFVIPELFDAIPLSKTLFTYLGFVKEIVSQMSGSDPHYGDYANCDYYLNEKIGYLTSKVIPEINDFIAETDFTLFILTGKDRFDFHNYDIALIYTRHRARLEDMLVLARELL